MDADIFCIQEIKLQQGQIELEIQWLLSILELCREKGVFRDSCFTKEKPLSVKYGVGDLEMEVEGRILTLEYPEFYLVNVYTPNAQRDLAQLILAPLK